MWEVLQTITIKIQLKTSLKKTYDFNVISLDDSSISHVCRDQLDKFKGATHKKRQALVNLNASLPTRQSYWGFEVLSHPLYYL